MRPLIAFVLALFLVPSAYAVALVLVPCQGSACRACDLVELVNNLLTFIITISILIATIIFMWAGFTFVTANGNVGQIKKAKDSFKDVFIGIIIVLVGFLIVDTVMQFLVGPDLLGGGKWNDIKCIPNPVINSSPTWNPDSSGTSTTPVTPGATSTSPLTPGGHSSIAAATTAYTGQSTAAGPAGGNLACAWAVNNILRGAGIAPIDGDSVPQMENALQGGRGTLVSPSSAGPGDIVIEAGRGHVGICQNAGCTQVISNSSGSRSFNWRSSTSFAPSYSSGPGRIYRVN